MAKILLIGGGPSKPIRQALGTLGHQVRWLQAHRQFENLKPDDYAAILVVKEASDHHLRSGVRKLQTKAPIVWVEKANWGSASEALESAGLDELTSTQTDEKVTVKPPSVSSSSAAPLTTLPAPIPGPKASTDLMSTADTPTVHAWAHLHLEVEPWLVREPARLVALVQGSLLEEMLQPPHNIVSLVDESIQARRAIWDEDPDYRRACARRWLRQLLVRQLSSGLPQGKQADYAAEAREIFGAGLNYAAISGIRRELFKDVGYWDWLKSRGLITRIGGLSTSKLPNLPEHLRSEVERLAREAEARREGNIRVRQEIPVTVTSPKLLEARLAAPTKTHEVTLDIPGWIEAYYWRCKTQGFVPRVTSDAMNQEFVEAFPNRKEVPFRVAVPIFERLFGAHTRIRHNRRLKKDQQVRAEASSPAPIAASVEAALSLLGTGPAEPIRTPKPDDKDATIASLQQEVTRLLAELGQASRGNERPAAVPDEYASVLRALEAVKEMEVAKKTMTLSGGRVILIVKNLPLPKE